MDSKQIKLYKIICQQFAIKFEKITNETSLRDELYADSLDIMESCDILEGEFDLPTLTQDKIASIHKVGDLMELIEPCYLDNRE